MMIIDPPRTVAYVISRGKALEVKTVFQGVRGTPKMADGISMFPLPTDPQDPRENWVSVECKAVGTEMIEERSTTRWDLTDRFQEQTWHTYTWVDVRLHVVSKRQFMENTFELRNIVEAPQASGVFDVP